MDAGTIEQTLPGLEHAPTEPALKPGHAIPLTPQKRLMVFSGRSHTALAERIAERLGRRSRRDRAEDSSQRGDLLPLLRVDPRRRRLPRPDGMPAGRPAPDGAAADDPGREARLREADHGGDPMVPVFAPGPEGEAARADLRAARRRHAPARWRRPALDHGPPRGPDPGVLHDPRRPHDGVSSSSPATSATSGSAATASSPSHRTPGGQRSPFGSPKCSTRSSP